MNPSSKKPARPVAAPGKQCSDDRILVLSALYVDFNSYFASVEQQLRPDLRGKPVAVLPVVAETTCCIAASYEAKAFGVKTGTRVSDARKMCPGITLVEARPQLYVEFHYRLVEAVESCTPVEKTLSIDEMVCRLTGSQQQRGAALALATRIKQTIRRSVGEHIRSSIGIAPNTFLAKVASNMQKPDGCIVIEAHELPEKLYTLELRDLNGIGGKMAARLQRHGIRSVRDLYAANRQQLCTAWGSIEGGHMYDRLRGVESMRHEHERRSLGHSHVLPPELRNRQAAISVLHRLLQKACSRLRNYGLYAANISAKIKFLNHPTWQSSKDCSPTDDTLLLLRALDQLCKGYPARELVPYAVGVSLGGLAPPHTSSLDLFESVPGRDRTRLDDTLDQLNQRYGKHTVYFGGAHSALMSAPMRIAFNHIPDLAVENDGMHSKTP